MDWTDRLCDSENNCDSMFFLINFNAEKERLARAPLPPQNRDEAVCRPKEERES
jgi:hypothetical protein